jgi:acetyltransferase-like isoleucine patch superfamily enzyme
MMGTSLIGASCFLGVGAKLLDISFTRRDLTITTAYEEYQTNRRELGALVGDRVRIGSGAVLSPCTHVGRNSIIYPLVSAFGVVPPNSSLSHEKSPIVKIRESG